MPLPKCPICGTEHILKTDPRHGGNDLTDCVKGLAKKFAIAERLVKLETGASLEEVLAAAEKRAQAEAEQVPASSPAETPAASPAADPSPVAQTAETTGPAAV